MSMRDYLDFNSKLNELRMIIRHPLSSGKAMLIVEGNADKKFFRSLLCDEKTIIESISGKPSLKKTISVLIDEGVGAVFGICDADFDNLDGKRDEYIKSYIFPTDAHDIEMMMFDSPSLDAGCN